VQQLTNLAVSKGYDGIDLDYEVFAFTDGRASWPTTQPNWVAFIAELGASLHANGKLLSVTVPPVWNGGANGYTVYAQADIAPHADRIRLMVYDWSVSTAGPIAPMFWVDSVMAYSNSVVPASKLQLGVPAYGRHWSVQKNANELCPDGAVARDSITMEEAPRLAASKGLTPTRKFSTGQVPAAQVWGEMTFSWEQTVTGPRTAPAPPVYTPPVDRVGTVNGTGDPGLAPAIRLTPPSNFVTCTITHIVYYPDAWAVRERAQRATAAGWKGIYLWALGYETADVWPIIADIP
jgi:spore germination protein YaaH